jgi:UDP-N-acetylglucosamine acyltransferase
MKRRGFTRDDMRRLRRANIELFGGPGTFPERVEAAARKYAGDPIVSKVIAFIQQGKTRALVQPARGLIPEDSGSA